MESFNKIIFTILLITVSSCKSMHEADNSLKSINIGDNIKKMDIVNLSKFTDDVRYVVLETKENLHLSNIKHLDFSEDYIIVTDMNVCLLYNTNGCFISKVGNKGRGPGEYPYVTNVNLGKNGIIYLSDTKNLYEYYNTGLLKKKYLNTILNEVYYLPSWILIDDSLLFGHVSNSDGQEVNKALIVNKYGQVKYFFRNYIFFKRAGSVSSTMENHAHIYKFKRNLYYKELHNDTLFYLSSDYHLVPKYSFSLGKYKEPIAEREKSLGNYNPYSYVHLFNVFQTENYLFLDCLLGNYFPAKRLTPKETQLFPQPIWHNTLNVLGVYDLRSRKLVFSEPTSTDNPLFTSGLYNDIDCGPRFFPKTMVNDSTMAMWVTADEIKTHVASADFKNNRSKYPEKKIQLKKLADSLNEFDNPVLMFVTFNQ